MRTLLVGLTVVSLLLAGCGGGSTTSATTTSSTGSTGTSTSTGTGTSTSTGTGTISSAPSGVNVTNAVIDQGPSALLAAGIAAVNIMYVNVTVCAPGSTTTCQTIDHVQVDTGSQGLRILSSVLNSTMLAALQPVTVNSAAVAECTQFVDGYSWGPVVSADVHIGGSDTATTGESAPSLPIQVIGTSTYPVPADCSSVGGTSENTVATFGANGIIGVGLFDQDCGQACAQEANNSLYYTCTSSGCNAAAVPLTEQTLNPVYGLAANSSSAATDNNGVIIILPAVGAGGAATATGYLVFGIGTETNNALSSTAAVLTTDTTYGYVSATFNGTTYPDSYFDSGSNAIYFNDSSIPNCSGSSAGDNFMCPASQLSLTATATGENGTSATVEFAVANASTLFTNYPSYAAFSNLGGSATLTSSSGGNGGGSGNDSDSGSTTFAFGLPIFYGNYMYAAMQQVNAGGTDGPYFAVAPQ